MKTRHYPRIAVIPALLIGLTIPLGAATHRNVDVPERLKGAERTVVGKVVRVQPRMVRNIYGDELIVSRVQLHIEETLKGASAQAIDVEVEGGTVGDLTLNVSDMPTLSVGQRGVFFLERGPGGEHVPHLRGLGILKLDARDVVERSSLTLDAIRTMARQAGAR